MRCALLIILIVAHRAIADDCGFSAQGLCKSRIENDKMGTPRKIQTYNTISTKHGSNGNKIYSWEVSDAQNQEILNDMISPNSVGSKKNKRSTISEQMQEQFITMSVANLNEKIKFYNNNNLKAEAASDRDGFMLSQYNSAIANLEDLFKLLFNSGLRGNSVTAIGVALEGEQAKIEAIIKDVKHNRSHAETPFACDLLEDCSGKMKSLDSLMDRTTEYGRRLPEIRGLNSSEEVNPFVLIYKKAMQDLTERIADLKTVCIKVIPLNFFKAVNTYMFNQNINYIMFELSNILSVTDYVSVLHRQIVRSIVGKDYRSALDDYRFYSEIQASTGVECDSSIFKIIESVYTYNRTDEFNSNIIKIVMFTLRLENVTTTIDVFTYLYEKIMSGVTKLNDDYVLLMLYGSVKVEMAKPNYAELDGALQNRFEQLKTDLNTVTNNITELWINQLFNRNFTEMEKYLERAYLEDFKFNTPILVKMIEIIILHDRIKDMVVLQNDMISLFSRFLGKESNLQFLLTEQFEAYNELLHLMLVDDNIHNMNVFRVVDRLIDTANNKKFFLKVDQSTELEAVAGKLPKSIWNLIRYKECTIKSVQYGEYLYPGDRFYVNIDNQTRSEPQPVFSCNHSNQKLCDGSDSTFKWQFIYKEKSNAFQILNRQNKRYLILTRKLDRSHYSIETGNEVSESINWNVELSDDNVTFVIKPADRGNNGFFLYSQHYPLDEGKRSTYCSSVNPNRPPVPRMLWNVSCAADLQN